MVPIKEYLKKYITVTEYMELVKQTISLLQKLQGEGMSFELQLDKLQIQNGKLCVQTKAEDSVYELEYVKKFIKELTFAAVFSIKEDCRQVTNFMHYLDEQKNMRSLDEIIRYLNHDSSERMPQYTEHSAPQVMQVENGETGVLDPSFWENALKSTPSTRLGNSTEQNKVYGRLINVKTGQQTIINRDNFWVGKEGVDLQIEKDVISRRHAVIICKDNHFFVSDNDSTNKTYVDNKEIPAKATVEIFNGTRLKFANEEYVFEL